MMIALASPRIAQSLAHGLETIEHLIGQAAAQQARIVCFPEAYLPGLRGQDFPVLDWDEHQQQHTLAAVSHMAQTHTIAVILSTERITPAGRQIVALVIDASGQIQGLQTKNQLAPEEDQYYVPGIGRQIFQIDGLRFGIAICHEGWRYPETVRWAAMRGAQIVFQPQHTGNQQQGIRLTAWGSPEAPYYEKAMLMRSIENTIYFASVNYALHYQEAATALIHPNGTCQAYLPYGQEGVLVQELDLAAATGLLAQRYAPERYGEQAFMCSTAL